MADLEAEPKLNSSSPSSTTPLMNPNQTPQEPDETQLDQALKLLETFLCFLGFNQTSPSTLLLSWAAFLLLGVSIPVSVIELRSYRDRDRDREIYQIPKFELFILAWQAASAAISMLCVSHNLRKYGVRKFLFVDRDHGHVSRFRREYVKKIKGFFCMLSWWIVPCFLVKTAREIAYIIYVHQESWWQSLAVLLALVLSWTYLTTIFLSSCTLFNLVCNLQVIHFEDYVNLLDRDLGALVYLEEHMRLRHHLSKISHRFRIYLLLTLLITTASQIATLFQTTGYSGIMNFMNSGDFAVSSVVQVGGTSLCLHAAAKISHRAQSIASVASRWHALLTCNSTDASQVRTTNSVGNLLADPPSALSVNNSESDSESLDNVAFNTNTHITSSMSSYHKRQALVLYLRSNPGGFTIFGWTVDRGLMNTIFCIELPLVLFVLGKTIVFTK